MIASGLSKMRDSTSPGRMPPRARHRIWSNCQPDACTLSARRSISRWYSSQETYRCLPSSVSMRVVAPSSAGSLERVAQQDRVLAVGAGGHHVDRRADAAPACARGSAARWAAAGPIASAPAVVSLQPGKRLVDRLAGHDVVGVQRQDVERLPSQLVADADLDLGRPSSTSSLVRHRPETPLMMIERLSAAASNQPQRRGRPVTVPNSWPTRRQVVADACPARPSAARSGTGPLPTRVV